MSNEMRKGVQNFQYNDFVKIYSTVSLLNLGVMIERGSLVLIAAG